METAQPQISSYGVIGFAVDAAPFHLTESRHAARARIPTHRHGAPNLAIVMAGGFEETSGPHDRDCTPGTLIVHPGDDKHCDRIGNDGAVCLNIFVEGNDLPDHLRAIFSIERVFVSAHLRRLASRLHRRLRTLKADTAVIAEDTLELIALLPRGERSFKAPPKWLREIADRLNEEPNSSLRLGELARGAQVHPVHLSRSFFAHYGVTLGEHRRRRRIEWARDRLIEGDRSIAELALDAGYCDQAHFTRAFRARFGLSPTEFRRLERGT
jgi:AraC family transcriptional regulator